jgi:hypothetical protein
MTGNPEVIDSSVGLVPLNALVFTDSISLAWLVANLDKSRPRTPHGR